MRFWEPTFGRLITELGKKEVASAAFSPDGSRVVTASGSSAEVWDVSSGRAILLLEGHQDNVESASFIADGSRIFTSSADGTARIWDADSGNQVATFKVEAGTHCVAVSADGKRGVTASDKIARVWDVASGHEMIALEGHKGAIDSAAFSPDGGRIVTGSEDGSVGVWDVASGGWIGGFSVTDPGLWMRPPGNWVLSVAFSADGNYVVATTSQGVVVLMDVPRGKGRKKLVNYKVGKKLYEFVLWGRLGRLQSRRHSACDR
jgi:WD40 repeat protein